MWSCHSDFIIFLSSIMINFCLIKFTLYFYFHCERQACSIIICSSIHSFHFLQKERGVVLLARCFVKEEVRTRWSLLISTEVITDFSFCLFNTSTDIFWPQLWPLLRESMARFLLRFLQFRHFFVSVEISITGWPLLFSKRYVTVFWQKAVCV